MNNDSLDNGMEEDLEELAGERRRDREKGDNFFPHFIFVGAIGIIVLIVIFALFFGKKEKVSVEDVNALAVKIGQLEKKLNQQAGADQQVVRLEGQVEEIRQSVSKLDGPVRSVEKRLSLLSQKVDQLDKKTSALEGTVQKPAKEVKKPVSQVKKGHHEVRRGETLYKIAREYGMSLDEIRRMNNLSKDQKIYAGQKLLVNSK